MINKVVFGFVAIILSFACNSQIITYNQLDTMKMHKSIESALKQPSEVYRLDLSKEKLKEFPNEILQFTNLNELILDKNKLKSIPREINEFEYLQRLSIFSNKLTDISFITGLPNLVTLDLSENYIVAIPDSIYNLSRLEELILQMNIISYFPETLEELDSLKVLNLLDNDMNYIEQDFLIDLLPNIDIKFSTPCNCDFSE